MGRPRSMGIRGRCVLIALLIGLFVAVAVGALLKQQHARQGTPTSEGAAQEGAEETLGAGAAVALTEQVRDQVDISPGPDAIVSMEGSASTPDAVAAPAIEVPPGGHVAPLVQETGQGGLAMIQEEIVPLDPVLAAKPISSPSAVSSATYSSAGIGEASPYAYGAAAEPKKKAKPSATLLRWCGRTGSLQVGELVILGPVTYWSDGPSSTSEPCCIDVALPVEWPSEEGPLPVDGAVSYREMTPLQRGVYLTWLAGGRIQPPIHACYPGLWLCGLERRVLVDRLDMGPCIAEAFRMLPLMRWDAMLQAMIRFITWLAVKIWLPEDELLAFCKRLSTVPDELLGMSLGPYANAKLPLPSVVAFTLMRASARLREAALGPGAPQIAHSEELLQRFTPLYKEACRGGLILGKPKTSQTLTYVPTNPSLAAQKDGAAQPQGGVVELPDFFADLSVYEPLFAVWRELVASLAPRVPETAAEMVEGRPDFEALIESLRPEGSDAPLLTDLGALGAIMGMDPSTEKVHGRDRKSMVDTAQVEGYQIVPDLGLSGREYRWDEKILFLPMELGARPSQDYLTASFLLELICSLTGARDQHAFEPLRRRLDDYFALSSEDDMRLDEQRWLLPTSHALEAYGEIVQLLLQGEDRAALRDFLIDFLSFLPEGRTGAEELRGRICAALGLAPDAPPPFEERPTMERGAAIVKALAPSFRR